jgi:1,3-beta-glucan synthase
VLLDIALTIIRRLVDPAFAVMLSGWMFGDRVVGKSRKDFANQTFTATSYPSLEKAKWLATRSVGLWFLVGDSSS